MNCFYFNLKFTRIPVILLRASALKFIPVALGLVFVLGSLWYFHRKLYNKFSQLRKCDSVCHKHASFYLSPSLPSQRPLFLAFPLHVSISGPQISDTHTNKGLASFRIIVETHGIWAKAIV